MLTASRLVLGRATGANNLLAREDNFVPGFIRTEAIATSRLVFEICARYGRKGKKKKIEGEMLNLVYLLVI